MNYPATNGVTFVLGGARSGKSRFAENLARQTGLEKVYLATGEARDDEMLARVEAHKAQRASDGWRTIEEPVELIVALQRETAKGRVVLVDCLTLWLTNLMMTDRNMEEEIAAFVMQIRDLPGSLILVSNEVGLGIVPENALARRFRDHAGSLHQKIAAQAVSVVFIAAGLPLKLKG